MSFKSTFSVAGNTYDLIQCKVFLEQKYSQNGKPASGVHAGFVRLIVEGTDDDTFGSWIGDPTKKQDGKIVFYRADQSDTKFKEVKIEGGYLLTLLENFTVENETSQALLMESGSDLDIGPGDGDEAVQVFKRSYTELLNCQKATGRSYCVLLRISAEKITIDGVEHES